jgi:HEPN domain-containing protein
MKQLPLEYYEKFPFARKALLFLNAAKTANEISNRQEGSWEVSFYLLSHAVELSIKAVAYYKTQIEPSWGHDKVELAERYRIECDFSEDELITISTLKDLNNGPGGLRYDNDIIGKFYPSDFNKGVGIIERLLTCFEPQSD